MHMPKKLLVERAAVQEKFKKANTNLAERLSSTSKSLEYDRDEDVLIVTLGQPQEAVTISSGSWLFMRLHPDTFELVGVEIHNVKRHLDDPHVRSLYDETLALDHQLAKNLMDLVPA